MRARPEGVRVESCALGRPGRGGPPGRCACDGSVSPAAQGVLGADEGDVAPVPPDRREGTAGGRRPAQPLVERSLPSDRRRHHHPAQRPARRRHGVHRRLRLHHPPPPDSHPRRAPGVLPPDRPVGRRLLPGVHRRASVPGHRCRSGAPVPLRPARRRPAVRRGRRTRHVRPGRREPLLDDPHPGDAGPGEVRRRLLRENQPRPPLLAHLRPRRHPVLRPACGTRPVRRSRDPRGVLA